MRSLVAVGILLACLPALSQPQPAARRDIVGAYYYPWYTPSKWKAHAPQLTPSLGWYRTDSLPVVIKHIDTAAYHGVDVLFMSWWKENDVSDQHLQNGYLKAPNNHKVKFAMLMEPLGDLGALDGKVDEVVDFSVPAVLEGWIGRFRYFKEKYFGHPSYFRIGGKPVVLIYVTRTFRNFGPAHLDSLRRRVGDVYLMADEAFLGQQADPESARNGIRNRNPVFDSYVSYNAYEAGRILPGDSALAYQTRVAMPYYRAWAEKTLFHPPIMPYYRDFRDGHPPLPGSTGAFREIIRQIRSLPIHHPASDSVNRVYMVTSWNEWFEGTSIEPSVEHGNSFAKVLREAFVEDGTASRREAVRPILEYPARLKSAESGAPVCLESTGLRTVPAPGECPAGGMDLVIVELEGDGVAFKHPRDGRFVSHHSDHRLYPMQDYIGTWEIFEPVRAGDRVAFRSRKNGGWIKAGAGGALSAAGPDLDARAYFVLEKRPAVTRRRAAPAGLSGDAGFHLSVTGGVWRLRTARQGTFRVTLTDLQGRSLAAYRLDGPGLLAWDGAPRGGLAVIGIRGASGSWSRLLPALGHEVPRTASDAVGSAAP